MRPRKTLWRTAAASDQTDQSDQSDRSDQTRRPASRSRPLAGDGSDGAEAGPGPHVGFKQHGLCMQEADRNPSNRALILAWARLT